MSKKPPPDDFSFAEHYFVLHGRYDGARLHYVDEGQGEAVLCLHGNPTWSYAFRSLINSLKGNYRVLALDHLGCGKSSKPTDFSYRLQDHIDNLRQFIEHLGLTKVTLIVHDWGGAIGMGWAVSHPHQVEKLVVLNTAAFRSKSIPFSIALCKIPVFGEFLMRGLNAFSRGLVLFGSTKKLSKEVKAQYLEPYRTYDARLAVARFVQDIPLHRWHPSYITLFTIEKNLPKLAELPMLLLWGEKDFCFHLGFFKRWQELFPKAKKVTLPQAGHLLFEDEPKRVGDEIATFLRA